MNPFQWCVAACVSVADKFRPRKPGEVRLLRKPDNFDRTLADSIPVISGAENWGGKLREVTADLGRTRELEVVPAKKNGGHARLLEDTAEFTVIFVSLVRKSPKLKRDELGSWDPSTADWSTPAFIFEDTVRGTWTDWTATVPPEDRPAIAYALADKILCGV